MGAALEVLAAAAAAAAPAAVPGAGPGRSRRLEPAAPSGAGSCSGAGASGSAARSSAAAATAPAGGPLPSAASHAAVASPPPAVVGSCLCLLRALLLHDGRCLLLAAWLLGEAGGGAGASPRAGEAASRQRSEVLTWQPLWAAWGSGHQSSSGAQRAGDAGGSTGTKAGALSGSSQGRAGEAGPSSNPSGSQGGVLGPNGATGSLLGPLIGLALAAGQEEGIVRAVAGVLQVLAARLPAHSARKVGQAGWRVQAWPAQPWATWHLHVPAPRAPACTRCPLPSSRRFLPVPLSPPLHRLPPPSSTLTAHCPAAPPPFSL